MSERVYGFDIGGTLIKPGHSGMEKEPWDHAFRVVKRIVTELSPKAYIVSRVNEEQKKRALWWLDKYSVHEMTGIPKENVFWCAERPQKAPIIKDLGITHFVDDRPEVFAACAGLGRNLTKILIKPDPYDLYSWSWCMNNFTVCQDWLEIEDFAFHKRQP